MESFSYGLNEPGTRDVASRRMDRWAGAHRPFIQFYIRSTKVKKRFNRRAACSIFSDVKSLAIPMLGKKFCLQWGLNSRPLVYKTSALPLSYRGLVYCCNSITCDFFINRFGNEVKIHMKHLICKHSATYSQKILGCTSAYKISSSTIVQR